MGRPIKDLTGQRFGMLMAIRVVKQSEEGRAIWLCRCDCGKTIKRTNGHLTSGLRHNTRSSCGCGPKGNRPTHSDTGSTEYRTWRGMRERCYKKTHHKYHLYGKKGIRVFKEWRDNYQAFLDYVGRKPTSQHTLDRWPNPSGNYEPGNVRWTTSIHQRHNRRTT